MSEGEASDPKLEAATKPRPKKARKKRRAATADGAVELRRAELDSDGRDRPRFLLNFPEDQELEQVIQAFEAGNYALVRELAPRLAEHDSEAVREAAAELARRIEPDPLMKYLLLAAGLLLGVLILFAYTQHGGHVER